MECHVFNERYFYSYLVKVKLPVTWPSGTYGLNMPISGCPLDPVGFETGYLTQDTEDTGNRNSQSTLLHIKGTIPFFKIKVL